MKSTFARALFDGEERLEVGISVLFLVEELDESVPLECPDSASFPHGDGSHKALQAGRALVEDDSATSAGASSARSTWPPRTTPSTTSSTSMANVRPPDRWSSSESGECRTLL